MPVIKWLYVHNCNIIWSNTFPSHLQKLLILQTKIIHAISCSIFWYLMAPLIHYSAAVAF